MADPGGYYAALGCSPDADMKELRTGWLAEITRLFSDHVLNDSFNGFAKKTWSKKRRKLLDGPPVRQVTFASFLDRVLSECFNSFAKFPVQK